ncbi:MAG: FHA domain-containing protein [Acidimicrobiales bacterium]
MDAHLEVWTLGEAELVPLESSDLSIGRADGSDISLPFDPTVSRLHAVVVRYRGGCCLRDVGWANGTSLNGRRLLSEQMLRPGDEIRVGSTRIVFRATSSESLAANATKQGVRQRRPGADTPRTGRARRAVPPTASQARGKRLVPSSNSLRTTSSGYWTTSRPTRPSGS